MLSDEIKWEVYCGHLAMSAFDDGKRPDPFRLQLLLKNLGVTLEQIEGHLEGDYDDEPEVKTE